MQNNVNTFLAQMAMKRPLDELAGTVDVDMLFVLQEEDVPRVHELVRTLFNTLNKIAHKSPHDEQDAEIIDLAVNSVNKCEEIARDGLDFPELNYDS